MKWSEFHRQVDALDRRLTAKDRKRDFEVIVTAPAPPSRGDVIHPVQELVAVLPEGAEPGDDVSVLELRIGAHGPCPDCKDGVEFNVTEFDA